MLVLTNARVFDGTRLLPGTHDVSVQKRRIASVDPAGAGPQGDVVDLEGMTLLPGLITSHLHPDFYKYELASGLRPGLERPPGVMMAIGVRTCRVLLESGFTGYSGAACAHDVDAQLKMAIEDGIVPGPRIRACGHHIGTTGDVNNQDAWWRRPGSVGVDLAADGPTELRRLVRDEIRRGVQTIKIFASAGHGIPGPNRRNLSRDEIAAVVDAAHERGAKVRAHVTDRAMILECLDLGVDVIDHGDEVDDECIARMAESGTFWVPSLVYPSSLLEIGYARHFGVTREAFDHVREILPAAHQAGVRILVGDDYSGVLRDLIEDDPLDHEVGNYGRELAFYAAIDGLSPADVLTWATRNAGQLLVDPPDRVGVIEPGALADLIVVDGDPLADLTLLARPEEALRAVIRDGSFAINRLPGIQGGST
jgi:imidazolonepropionase-like amidohydrolase